MEMAGGARSLVPDSSDAEAIRQPERPRRFMTAVATLGAVGAVFAFGALVYTRQKTTQSVVARGPLGEEVTVLEENPCDLYPYLKFELPAAVTNNNLAHKGPDRAAEGIVYKTVDLGRGAGDELDREVLLVVNATSNQYKPFSPRLNGMQGKYGSINLNSGSSVDLLYNFYDLETMDKLTLPEFAMTWFDLDTGSNGASVEYVIIGGFKSYHLTGSTEVKVEKQPDGRTKFSASTYGTGEDNPKDPMFLTQQQKNRAVTLLYGRTESISVTIGATAGRGPRFFTFVGRPSLLCAVTVQQNFKPPLPDLTFSPPMEKGTMCEEGETFVSFAVPKGAQVKKGDLIATTKKKDGTIVEHKAPFDGTVTAMQDQLKPGEKLDLRLSEKILAVVKRPSLANLPQDEAAGVIGGGPGEDVHEHAQFKKYFVNVGDKVAEGDDIALVENSHGEEIKIKSVGYGMVKARQEGMKPGMILASVPDGNLVTLAKYPGLGSGPDNTPSATVPNGGKGLTFKEYHVKRGDIIKVGDPIATVVDEDGNEEIIKATHGGVVSALEDLKEGAPMERVEGDTIATTGKFPPLPVGPGQAPLDSSGAAGSPKAPSSADQSGSPSETDAAAAAARGSGEQPLPQQGSIPQDGLKFVKYYVKPKDVVETGDPIAQVQDKDGTTHDILAPRPGVVTATQDGLKEGMVIDNVMSDRNLAVIDKLPVLDISDSEDGSFAPPIESWKFKEWKVKTGDTVKKGDVVAILENPTTGETKKVLAGRSGEVSETLEQIQPGDDVEESTGDSDLATIGLASGPPVYFREVEAKVDDNDCTFEDWRIKKGEKVHFGDTIAHVKLPVRRLDGSGRRLSSIIPIPSPGTGHVSYMADLVPGQKISQRTSSTTIAKVDLGWPWWLLLLAALMILCCCFCCLFKIMQKQPAYKPMPPVVAPAPEPEPPAPVPKPSGLRLDFEDRGTIRTVYAKYKPLGIKHSHTAPIVVHDFTVNSYAKQELGVQPNWKLTRIGDRELNNSTDFESVTGSLELYMRDMPIWPLPLEFRKNPDDAETHVYKFVERPLGMEFTNVAPIKVDRVYPNSPAAAQKVEPGWYLTKIGDADVHETANFREVLKYFKEGVTGLGDEGHKYTQLAQPTNS